MRFDYIGLISSAPDTGEGIVIFRPEVRLRLHGPNGSEGSVALVDTGAQTTRYSQKRSLGRWESGWFPEKVRQRGRSADRR